MSTAKLVLLGEEGEHPHTDLPAFFLLTKNCTTFGRSSSADITCDSPTYSRSLSRIHVTFTRKEISSGKYSWHVTDSETINGTFLNHIKVHESIISTNPWWWCRT